ncbi:hypothetical protein [Psychroflexus aestuariivivens]|uniref:hypothetical protein n=1 Tax=Psychroflexus aestuariivivens TaxID=1795040 RepID=UPI000FD72FD2|nr:hypothetical protein [Psychroflexus aestuariivivens]
MRIINILVSRSLSRISLLLFFLINSCINSYETSKSIPGSWVIENISYTGIDYKDSLGYNMIFFETAKNNKIVTIPRTSYSNRVISKWNQLEDNYILINSSNKLFNGKFEIKYFRDKKRNLIGAIFESNNTTIEAYKLGNGYSDE